MERESIDLPDGTRYEGAIEDGEANGHGVMTFPDGARYEATWEDGEPVTAAEQPA